MSSISSTTAGAGNETKTGTRVFSGKVLEQTPSLNLKEDLENELYQLNDGKRSNGKKRYILDKYLGGKQGDSAVYSAKDTRGGGNVALKFVHARDEDVKRRFKREVAMQSQLSHPNIVGVKRDEPLSSLDGTLMIAVLEYLPNGSVQQYVQQLDDSNPPDEKFVVQMAMDVLNGLICIHRNGIVHKDIKCANLLRDGLNSSHFKIADFGIAAMDDTSKSNVSDTMNTMQIRTVGTPHYMSLEHHTGQNVSFPADLYSLGVVMYRCLSGGKFPYGDQATNAQMILLALFSSPSVPPINNVSDPLFAIVTKALQKQVADRYSTATDMLKDLKNIQPTQKMKPYIFLSYRRSHNGSARSLKMELEKLGNKVFFDLDRESGIGVGEFQPQLEEE
jgi:serine/threonine protein kinase